MTEAKAPDYRVFAFHKGGGPRTYQREGKEYWKKDGAAWTNQNKDATKSFLRGTFQVAGQGPEYKFKAYPSKATDADPTAQRPPDYHLFLLDEKGRVPTTPDPNDPTRELWQSSCGLWLKRSKNALTTYLRGVVTLDGQEVVLQVFHVSPTA